MNSIYLFMTGLVMISLSQIT